MKTLKVIDSHTGGEPTRLVVDGFPDLGNGSLSQRLDVLRERFDDWRAGAATEPRGNDVVVGALLCTPDDPECAAGVIFFNNVGYLGMCGHGTIGLIVSLAHMGRLGTGRHKIQTPVGNVDATLHADGSVSVENVPAYRYRHAVNVEVPGYGVFCGDIAWGGNWFFLVSEHGQTIAPWAIDSLTRLCAAIRDALVASGITGADGAMIDHIELFGPGSRAEYDSRNFVLCPGSAYDRSPCGTGTSAKLACLAADGKLVEGADWQQESIIGSVFTGRYRRGTSTDASTSTSPHTPASIDTIVPTITGRAYITAETTLCFADADPFRYGIPAV